MTFAERARESALRVMKERDNCATAVLLGVADAFGVGIPEPLVDSSGFLREGMFSGCCCGALSGAMMASGVLNGIRPHPLGAQLPKALHDAFRERFGATCCRAIRARRTLLQRIGRNACRDLTAETAAMTADFWAPVFEEAQRRAKRTPDIAKT
jgi:C_GCAxxG_C_C family probable redox protein